MENHYKKCEQKQLEKLLTNKKKNGLLDSERLHPGDSKCFQPFIKNVEILAEKQDIHQHNEPCTHFTQKVTYIDNSEKVFEVYVTLSSIFPSKEVEDQVIKRKNR